jgi:uroporphyrinogen-III synthase
MRLLVTRPEQDAAPLKRKLEGRGHDVTLWPLLKIVPRAAVTIPDKKWQAVCATSANALRNFEGMAAIEHLPLLTVGPQSLAAGREAGFAKASAHGGDVRGLAAYIEAHLQPETGPLLYLAGAEVSGDLAAKLEGVGFAVTKLVVYDAVPCNAALLGEALRGQDGVLLYSPRSARIFADTAPADVADALVYYCLSGNVAAALPKRWISHVAETPDEDSLLALLDRHARTL